MFPMETNPVAPDNSRVLTVKLRRETSLVAYSTEKRSILHGELKYITPRVCCTSCTGTPDTWIKLK